MSTEEVYEDIEPQAQTYGTPGFLVWPYYKPMDGKFSMKVCPAPQFPPYLIKEVTDQKKNKRFSFCGLYTFFVFGWLITHTIGFWSAIRLFINILHQDLARDHIIFFRHMDKLSTLTIGNKNPR
ncbi:MAG: hypothetical protein IPK25_16445 [Saprospiraceae bacterium]|nr:hypothetical protein [Saprospiraceae bacterium]